MMTQLNFYLEIPISAHVLAWRTNSHSGYRTKECSGTSTVAEKFCRSAS